MTFLPTPEQQAIIEYPLLPLRVIAGAGTGKTTTLVTLAERLQSENPEKRIQKKPSLLSA